MPATSSGAKALLAAATLIAPIALVDGATAGAATRPALADPSGNPYFPLVAGSTWKYEEVGGPTAGSVMVVHVAGAHRTAAGEAVEIQDTTAAGAFTAQYVIGANGSIEVQASAGSGSAKATISGAGSYFIPSAAQIISCHACHFIAELTTSVMGLPTPMHEHLTETVTSMGVTPVHVPAGSYSAEKLQMVLKVSASESGISFSDTASFAVFLVKNVGLVETGGGTVSTSVMGHSTNVETGSEVLVRYTP